MVNLRTIGIRLEAGFLLATDESEPRASSTDENEPTPS
jgi:hypothetical protein